MTKVAIERRLLEYLLVCASDPRDESLRFLVLIGIRQMYAVEAHIAGGDLSALEGARVLQTSRTSFLKLAAF